ncbi:MAG: tRNA (guanosine(37)-N1)-methyltransferase TrmD [Elusimicrobiota bacterium]
MKIDLVTIFPEMFGAALEASLLGKAQKNGIAQISIHNLRKWTKDKHRIVDDRPYGGGAGMLLKAEPIWLALKELKKRAAKSSRVILLTPQGKIFDQKKAAELSRKKHLIFVCGHYEGFDERITKFVDEEISIGDFVLTGGELAALVVIEAVVRLLPGVVGNKSSLKEDSFAKKFLDWPHYTRPANFRGREVPDILLSGDHQKINLWRKKEAIRATIKKRPELIAKIKLSPIEKKMLKEVIKEENFEEKEQDHGNSKFTG